MKTNFEKVIDFCKCSNQPVYNEYKKDIFDTNPDRVDLRLKLIEEEVGELQEAIKTKNFTEVIDALSDILYVTYGAGAEFGIDLDKTFDLVHESNMSKFCKTEEEAIETVKWYEENEKRYSGVHYVKSNDGVHWVVRDQNGKTLKSYKYHPVSFD